MNIHQTSAHAIFLASIGWKIEQICVDKQTVYAFVRTLPLFSISLIKLQRIPYHLIDWDWVDFLEKKYRAFQTVVELDETSDQPLTNHEGLLERNFFSAKDFMLNTKTRYINLKQTESQLLSQMKPKTRYNLHLAQRNNLITTLTSCNEVAHDVKRFDRLFALLHQNARRINMLLLPKDWIFKQFTAYGENGIVVEITHPKSNQLLSAATFYTSSSTCSYNLNGSTDSGRKMMAPTIALWEGIRWAKQHNFPYFDFDGIYDERYPKTQQRFKGFGRFKAGFGGQEKYFYPMYKRWRLP